VTWRGTVYEFRYGVAPDFVDWALNISLVGELVAPNYSIMRSQIVRRLGQIP